MISTHTAFKKLVHSGMSEPLAETVTEIMEQRQDDLVTKSDLRASVAELRSEIQEVKSELHHNLNWIRAIGFLILGMLAKLTFFS